VCVCVCVCGGGRGGRAHVCTCICMHEHYVKQISGSFLRSNIYCMLSCSIAAQCAHHLMPTSAAGAGKLAPHAAVPPHPHSPLPPAAPALWIRHELCPSPCLQFVDAVSEATDELEPAPASTRPGEEAGACPRSTAPCTTSGSPKTLCMLHAPTLALAAR